MAPAMGLPMRVPKDWQKKAAPRRVPISRMSEIWAMRVGISEMKPPEEKPKMTTKTTMPAVSLMGIQMAKQKTPVSRQMTSVTLYRPSLSAIMPGRTRPKIL